MKLSEEKLTYLLFLYDIRGQKYTITNMANQLGVSKSTVSKVLSSFYQEGITEYKGKVELSKHGCMLAKQWKEEVKKITDWLCVSSSFDLQTAQKEAVVLTLYMSSSAKNQLIYNLNMSDFFKRIDHIKIVYGDMLVSDLKDGNYPFAFTIYKDKTDQRMEISMANDAFVHPGILKVQDGKGYLILESKEIERESLMGRIVLKGRLETLRYMKNKQFVKAMKQNHFYYIPVSCLEFYYNREEKMLQGHMKLKVTPTVGRMHMPESTAYLSIFFK